MNGHIVQYENSFGFYWNISTVNMIAETFIHYFTHLYINLLTKRGLCILFTKPINLFSVLIITY